MPRAPGVGSGRSRVPPPKKGGAAELRPVTPEARKGAAADAGRAAAKIGDVVESAFRSFDEFDNRVTGGVGGEVVRNVGPSVGGVIVGQALPVSNVVVDITNSPPVAAGLEPVLSKLGSQISTVIGGLPSNTPYLDSSANTPFIEALTNPETHEGIKELLGKLSSSTEYVAEIANKLNLDPVAFKEALDNAILQIGAEGGSADAIDKFSQIFDGFVALSRPEQVTQYNENLHEIVDPIFETSIMSKIYAYCAPHAAEAPIQETDTVGIVSGGLGTILSIIAVGLTVRAHRLANKDIDNSIVANLVNSDPTLEQKREILLQKNDLMKRYSDEQKWKSTWKHWGGFSVGFGTGSLIGWGGAALGLATGWPLLAVAGAAIGTAIFTRQYFTNELDKRYMPWEMDEKKQAQAFADVFTRLCDSHQGDLSKLENTIMNEYLERASGVVETVISNADKIENIDLSKLSDKQFEELAEEDLNSIKSDIGDDEEVKKLLPKSSTKITGPNKITDKELKQSLYRAAVLHVIKKRVESEGGWFSKTPGLRKYAEALLEKLEGQGNIGKYGPFLDNLGVKQPEVRIRESGIKAAVPPSDGLLPDLVLRLPVNSDGDLIPTGGQTSSPSSSSSSPQKSTTNRRRHQSLPLRKQASTKRVPVKEKPVKENPKNNTDMLFGVYKHGSLEIEAMKIKDYTNPKSVDYEREARLLRGFKTELTDIAYRTKVGELVARYIYHNHPSKKLSSSLVLNSVAQDLKAEDKEKIAAMTHLKVTNSQVAFGVLYRRGCDAQVSQKIAEFGFSDLMLKYTNDEGGFLKDNWHHHLVGQMGNDQQKNDFAVLLVHIHGYVSSVRAESNSRTKVVDNRRVDKILSGIGTSKLGVFIDHYKTQHQVEFENIMALYKDKNSEDLTPAMLDRIEDEEIKEKISAVNAIFHNKADVIICKPLFAKRGKDSNLGKLKQELGLDRGLSSGEETQGQKIDLTEVMASAGAKGEKVKVTDLKSDKKKNESIRAVRDQLENEIEFIEDILNATFEPKFGKIDVKRLIEFFMHNPSERHLDSGKLYGELVDDFLDQFDTNSKGILLREYLYPVMTKMIHLKNLEKFSDENKKLVDEDVKAALKYVGSPALVEDIKAFSPETICKYIQLCFNDLKIFKGVRSKDKKGSLLSSEQIKALVEMEKALGKQPSGTSIPKVVTVKLGAGEGKTFLSTIAPLMIDFENKPVIHVAPFGQYERDQGWEELPKRGNKIDFNKLKDGTHYWVRQDVLSVALKGKIDSRDKEILQNAYFYCDEYDRYPALNERLDELKCFTRCNMSATVNVQEVVSKIRDEIGTLNILREDYPILSPTVKAKLLQFQTEVENYVAQNIDSLKQKKGELEKEMNKEFNFKLDEFIKSGIMPPQKNAYQWSELQECLKNPGKNQKRIYDLYDEVKNSPGLERLLTLYPYVKFMKRKEKIIKIVEQYVDQMDKEFDKKGRKDGGGRDVKLNRNSEGGGCLKIMDQMIEKAKEVKVGGGVKKVQLIFQGAQFTPDVGFLGYTGERVRKEFTRIEISNIQEKCQAFYDESPVYVHMLAPKGLTGYSEGQSITMTYSAKEDGEPTWEIGEFLDEKELSLGTHVTLYDRFNKVGGDFGQHSNTVDFQACQVSKGATQSSKDDTERELLTKSLLYQMSKRNRGDVKRCDLHVFLDEEDFQGNSDSKGLLMNIGVLETKINKEAIKNRTQMKRGRKKANLFEETAKNWIKKLAKETDPRIVKKFESKIGEEKAKINESISDEDISEHTDGQMLNEWQPIFKSCYIDATREAISEDSVIRELGDLLGGNRANEVKTTFPTEPSYGLKRFLNLLGDAKKCEGYISELKPDHNTPIGDLLKYWLIHDGVGQVKGRALANWKARNNCREEIKDLLKIILEKEQAFLTNLFALFFSRGFSGDKGIYEGFPGTQNETNFFQDLRRIIKGSKIKGSKGIISLLNENKPYTFVEAADLDQYKAEIDKRSHRYKRFRYFMEKRD